MADNFARVATAEMTDFAWLSADGRVQQTQFANGVSMVANFGDAPAEAAGRLVPPQSVVRL